MTPYHWSGEVSIFMVALPSVSSCWTMEGRKYSPFMGFSARALSRKAGKRLLASCKKLGWKPMRFMDTMVSGARSTQVSPSSV